MLSLPRCKPILPLGHCCLPRGITAPHGRSIRSSSCSRKRHSASKHFSSPNNRSAVDDLDNLDLKLASSYSTTMPTVKREPSPSVLATWRSAKAVCFDVDSTLCVDESIDEIAAFLGVGEQVAALTSQLSFCFFNFNSILNSKIYNIF